MSTKVTEEDVSPPPSENLTKKSRNWLYWFSAGLAGLTAWNAVVFIPVHTALSDESDASLIAYRRWLVSPSQIVIDVRSVERTQSMAGMDRMLLKAAEALQNQSYDDVLLAYRGEGKMFMEGLYFQEIGATRQTQNPIYTMRTMQEHLTELDGTPAFDQWSGGWLGVLGKQLEDHNEFHNRWWLREAIGATDGLEIGF